MRDKIIKSYATLKRSKRTLTTFDENFRGKANIRLNLNIFHLVKIGNYNFFIPLFEKHYRNLISFLVRACREIKERFLVNCDDLKCLSKTKLQNLKYE